MPIVELVNLGFALKMIALIGFPTCLLSGSQYSLHSQANNIERFFHRQTLIPSQPNPGIWAHQQIE
jgi:hypothetical protein